MANLVTPGQQDDVHPAATPHVLGLVASPEPGGRTSAAVAAILQGAAAAGCTTNLVEMSERSQQDVIAEIERADGIVFGSPVYRATYSALLKALLESTERGRHGELTAPLRGKAAAIVLTGASAHHFLAVDSLRNVLASFFSVQVLSPGFYVDHSGYVDKKVLDVGPAKTAGLHGVALAELTLAIQGSTAMRDLEPLV
jgi:FMN reductase